MVSDNILPVYSSRDFTSHRQGVDPERVIQRLQTPLHLREVYFGFVRVGEEDTGLSVTPNEKLVQAWKLLALFGIRRVY